MHVESLPIHGALIVVPQTFGDQRGYFKEVFSVPRYEKIGITEAFVQDNISVSNRGVLRGLHGDPRMSKLVQVLQGEAFDVIVDIRPQSPTYRKWHGVWLAGEGQAQVFIPKGCLHGFLALAENTILLYKQTATYDPESEIGVVWNDPDIGIDWPLDGNEPRLSPKDTNNPTLAQIEHL
jgi:dTDP-4-dehydrorhamnose 3,5-epimerase